MSFLDTFFEMLVILFGIAAGYLAHRLGYLGGEIDQKISKIILNITMPCLILGSVISGSDLPDTAIILSLLWTSAIFYGIQIVVAMAAAPLLGGTPAQRGVWRYGLVFSNSAFIGYPVTVALFGSDALFYAVILVLPANIMSYTLGVLMLKGARRFRRKQLVSPCVIAAVLALFLVLTRIHLPSLTGELLNFVGDVTVPLSLLVVGSLLAGLPMKRIFASPRLWILTVLRLLVLPAILWAVLSWLGVDALVRGVAITLMAMPIAINGTMLSMEYGGDTECMAQATFLTTLVSIITIPVVAVLFL